jgi:nicotinate-nucleotide--dimethylbenzimidazole phosphoribosyltransferase
MTDTGQIPGEGLPENAGAEAGGEALLPPHSGLPGNGAPQQPGWGTDPAAAQGAPGYTYLDHPAPPGASLDDEDDVLLMPGSQGSWSDPQPVPPPPAPVRLQQSVNLPISVEVPLEVPLETVAPGMPGVTGYAAAHTPASVAGPVDAGPAGPGPAGAGHVGASASASASAESAGAGSAVPQGAGSSEPALPAPEVSAAPSPVAPVVSVAPVSVPVAGSGPAMALPAEVPPPAEQAGTNGPQPVAGADFAAAAGDSGAPQQAGVAEIAAGSADPLPAVGAPAPVTEQTGEPVGGGALPPAVPADAGSADAFAAGASPAGEPVEGQQFAPAASVSAAPSAPDAAGAPALASAPAPRRPLHMGPPVTDTPSGGVSVRSLADRGPAVSVPGPPTSGPEYLDVPRDDIAGIPGQQTGELGESAVPAVGGAWPAAAGGASQSLIPRADSVPPQENAAAVQVFQAAPVQAAVSEPQPRPEPQPQPVAAPAPASASAPEAGSDSESAPGEAVAPMPAAAAVDEAVHLVAQTAPVEPARAERTHVAVPVAASAPVSVSVVDAEVEAEAVIPAQSGPAFSVGAGVPAPADGPQFVPASGQLPGADELLEATAAVDDAPGAVAAAPSPDEAATADGDAPVEAQDSAAATPVAPVPAQQVAVEPESAPAAPEAEDEPAAAEAGAAPAPVSAAAPESALHAGESAPADATPAAGKGRRGRRRAAPAVEQLAEHTVVAVPMPSAEVDAQPAEDAEAPAPEPAAQEPAVPVSAAQAPAPERAVREPGPVPVPLPVAQGPAAEAYEPAVRDAVHRVIRERRDIRNGFRSDPIPHDVLLRVLEAAHTAPSVGHSQPWDFVVIRSEKTREKMHELATQQREAYAKSLPKGRARQFRELKIEAILDTPVNIVVTADPTRGGRHTLGRHTQPQMAPYSSALAVENLWLAARAEGLGVGWVSFFDERQMVTELGLPEHLEVVAYLCVGYVDEFPDEPELMQAGWSQRRPLSWVVHDEEYGNRALPGEEPHDLLEETLRGIRPLDAKALGEAWERQKRMTKPAGALGMLEIISAQLSGLSRQCPPPIPEPAAVAIFAGDHGVHAQGVTSWPQEVTAQMVANFLGGGAVVNAFANQVGAEVCVIDVGVASELPATPGLLPRKVRFGTADFTVGLAMSREEVLRAIEVGIETARDLVAAGNKALLTGEMGIANTTTSAALIAVFTGADPAEVTGRGTGINDEMHVRKIEVVRRALELHRPDPADPIAVLSAIGGLEHAAMVGLLLGAAALRTPVILDGVSAGAAALVARAIAPEVLAACIAGHRSAEPGHVAALTTLGLRPLVDLDLRLGEGTGALLALPLVQSAARVMHEVATFDAAGVTEKG